MPSGALRGTCSSSLSAATFPRATIKGAFNPETPIGSPRSDCRTKFATLSNASARQPETMSRVILQLWFSFTPSAGGVGNSTLAIETAIHLVRAKSSKGARVALVDLDFQFSHVCDYLDIAPKFQFEEIVAAPDRLDDHLLSAFISHHPSGLDVLAASRSRFHARDLSVEALSALFDRMAQRYSTIIIDLPLSVHSWTLPLLAASKGILVTGLNTIPGLRQIEETLRALRDEATITADVRAVVNRCDVGLLGKVARADHVARILGEEKRFCVRNAAVAVECVNVGSPIALAYPSDKSVKDVAAIAEFCVRL